MKTFWVGFVCGVLTCWAFIEWLWKIAMSRAAKALGVKPEDIL